MSLLDDVFGYDPAPGRWIPMSATELNGYVAQAGMNAQLQSQYVQVGLQNMSTGKGMAGVPGWMEYPIAAAHATRPKPEPTYAEDRDKWPHGTDPDALAWRWTKVLLWIAAALAAWVGLPIVVDITERMWNL